MAQNHVFLMLALELVEVNRYTHAKALGMRMRKLVLGLSVP